MGASDYSNTIEVTLSPVNPPAAPIDLTASMSGGYVVLNWQDVSTNEIQFYVFDLIHIDVTKGALHPVRRQCFCHIGIRQIHPIDRFHQFHSHNKITRRIRIFLVTQNRE